MAESNARTSAAAHDVEREFVITRIFDAPRELVFEVWTEPKHMAQWWGPRTVTNSVCEMDVRPGGAYRIVMRGPDGAEYPVKGVYREVVKPERLVMTMDCSEHPDEWQDLVKPNRQKGERNPAGEMLSTVTFEELDGKTKVTVRTRFNSAAIRDSMLKMGMTEGWSQSLDRLEELLATGSSDNKWRRNMAEKGTSPAEDTSARELVITRVFDAPRELVFDAMTDPKQVVQWWGPRGFTTTIHEMDVRPGGVWRHTMHGPDGTDYPNKSVFMEVVKPERIVYSLSGGKKGDPGAQCEATWTFEEQGGKTKLTLRMLFPSAAAREHVVKTYGAIEGGNQTLDRLGEHLAKSSAS